MTALADLMEAQTRLHVGHLPMRELWDDKRATYVIACTRTHLIEVSPMMFNDRLVLTPLSNPMVYDAFWCFPPGTAFDAAWTWLASDDDEPSGWIKRG